MIRNIRNPYMNETKPILEKRTRSKGFLLSLKDLTKGPFINELLVLEWPFEDVVGEGGAFTLS